MPELDDALQEFLKKPKAPLSGEGYQEPAEKSALSEWLGDFVKSQAPMLYPSEMERLATAPPEQRRAEAASAGMGLVGAVKPTPLQKILGPGKLGVEPLEQLAKQIPKVTKSPTLQENKKLLNIEGAKNTFATLREMAEQKWEAFKNITTTYGDWDTLIRKHVGTLQEGGLKVHQFGKELLAKYPNKLRREAMVNYIQANGDEALLMERAAKSKGKLQAGYHQALKMTGEEKAFAKDLRNYFDGMFDKAHEAGILEDYIEHYLPQIYEKGKIPESAHRLYAEVSSGLLQKNPFFAKKRFYDTYFAAEQAGKIPKIKDIGYLVSVYQNAFDRAVATRSFVKELTEGVAKDGRPLAHVGGYVKTLAGDEAKNINPAHLIKPKGTSEMFWDYGRGPENPAFRKWKWVDKDAAGNPVFLEGEMRFHPEIVKDVRAVFGKSAIRESGIGRAALTTIATMKGTLLDLSGFHQVQVGLHAAFHKVNPFNTPSIDLADPLTKKLIESGTMVFDHAGENLFAEGVSGARSLLRRIPGAGTYLDQYTGWLFKDYIPRLKMAMARGAYGRNMHVYGNKLSEDAILKLTSDQANAAFGELNYAALARNKTFQDVLRLTLLAPDFLEARARFAGQALRPYGREQLMAAVVRGTVGVYTGARIVNALLNNGDAKWDKPFSVIVGGKEFLTRSVPGDAFHLLKDPRSFIYHRLNPTLVRPGLEALHSRIYTGRWVSTEEQIIDFFKTHTPIPFQRTADQKWWQSVMNAMGVTAMDERSRALQEALKIQRRTAFAHPTEKLGEKAKLVNQYAKDLQKATKEERVEIKHKLQEDVKAKKLTAKDVTKIIGEAQYTPLQRVVKPMAIENALYIWGLASSEEKLAIAPLITRKIEGLDEDRRLELFPTLREFLLDLKAIQKEKKKATGGRDVIERLRDAKAGKAE